MPRCRREAQRLADHAAALVLHEEAVEDLAFVRQHAHRRVDRQRLVELFDHVVDALRLDVFAAGVLSREPLRMVSMQSLGGELREPHRAERRVVAQLLEVLVRAREHLLEDVVGVRLGQPERLVR